MAKMGKILAVIMILSAFIVLPAAAQSERDKYDLHSMYLNILRENGYEAEVDLTDNRKDIMFYCKYGDRYFIIIDENDLEFFQIYTGFYMTTITREQAIIMANEANRVSKVVKVTVSAPGSERIIISITAELLLEDPEDFINILTRALSLMRNADNNFKKQLN